MRSSESSALCCFAVLLILPLTLTAQHGPGAAPPVRSAPAEARQFDFLLGQWELVVRPQGTSLAARIHGLPKMIGTWKAWRSLDGWGVTDEIRITDEAGNPRGFTQATRMYDATTRKWNVSSADAYRGVFTTSTSELRDGVMTATSQGTDSDGKAYVSRGRYTAVTPTTFRFEQERSFDSGSKWTKTLIIDAKRIAASAAR